MRPGRRLHAGTGTASGSKPSAFRSLQRAAGTGVRIAFTFRSTSSGVTPPRITEATAGAPSENWRAATAIDTPWLSQTRSIRGDLVQDFGWRRAVVEVGAGLGAGGQNAGIEHAAEDDRDPLLLGQRKELVEGVLVQEQ